MKREVTLTAVRALQEEEEQILAEHGLKAERTIAALRVVLQVCRMGAFAAIAVSQGFFAHGLPSGLLRPIAALTYTIFCVVTLVVVFREKASVLKSKVMPFVAITADYGYLMIMVLTAAPYDGGVVTGTSAIFCLVLLGFGALRLRRMHVIYSAVLSVLTYGSAVLWGGDVVHPVPVVFTFVSFGVLTGLVLVLSSRINEMFRTLRTRDNLRRFLPKQVADRIERQNMRALDPVKREVTVLFSDIRDFTATSETMDPSAVLKFLDDYFGRMSLVVQARGGTVGKYIGDGMLCFWGVPEEDAQHAEHAVQAALDMRAVVGELNRERAGQGLSPLKIGVGIHTGMVAAGELGGRGEGLHEYTVIGDSVNLASRIEGLTKQHQVDILVSDGTWGRLGQRFVGRPCGEEKVKGRAEPVMVHTVTERTVAAGSALV